MIFKIAVIVFLTNDFQFLGLSTADFKKPKRVNFAEHILRRKRQTDHAAAGASPIYNPLFEKCELKLW